MKIKIIAASAILASAFNSSYTFRGNTTMYYWFLISKNFARSGAKPAGLKNANISHGFVLSTTSVAIPALSNFSDCGGTAYYCVASFTTAQLTSGHFYLKTSAVLSQTPFTAAYTRN